MERYFFHLRDGVDVLLDPDGQELDDLDAVARVAMREARALVAAEALSGFVHLDQRIDVENEQGELIHRVDFAVAVRIIRRASTPAAPDA